MSRLLLLLGPAASALSGIGVGLVLDWCIDQIFVHSSNIEKVSHFSRRKRAVICYKILFLINNCHYSSKLEYFFLTIIHYLALTS